VRAAGEALVGFSDAMAGEERAFKRFMYARLYHHPHQLAVAERARGIVAGLAAAYDADDRLLPEGWRARMPADEPWRTRHIADFIAGMTDRYAIARYREVVGRWRCRRGFDALSRRGRGGPCPRAESGSEGEGLLLSAARAREEEEALTHPPPLRGLGPSLSRRERA
jgi:hypothetical protein